MLSAMTLFDETSFQSLIADRKAFSVGDLITVFIAETTDAESALSNTSQKNRQVGMTASFRQTPLQIGGSLEGKGQQQDKIGRHGLFKAVITTRITQINESNQFIISGKKAFYLNGEKQWLTLSGMIRKEDISGQNTILSNRIHDLSIHYSGSNSKQLKPRWLSSLLSFIGILP